jgi:alkaline phosphatase
MKNIKILCIIWLSVCGCLTEAKQNVILMISDGQGYNTLNAANMYLGYNFMEQFGFNVKMSMQTYSASNPAGDYNAVKMWGDIKWARNIPTDSAAAASAMYTGKKHYNDAINQINSQNTATIFDLASERGYATGAITTVEFSHATPAACGAHNPNRENYSEIANEMIFKSGLDVIMGAGHPFFNDDGTQRNVPDYNYIGGKNTWEQIAANQANHFTMIETKTDFEQLAMGNLHSDKVIGILQAATTAQQARPAGEEFNTNVPSLATMSTGALNVLNKNANGFCIMIEGGAVDWANHANQKDRMIEEELDFFTAVSAVIEWVEKNSSWNDTLLIITADHECGFLTGDVNSLGDIAGNGILSIPKMEFNSKKHTNSLVPFFAKGKNAEMFNNYIIGSDKIGSYFYFGINGRNYIDNTAIFKVMDCTMSEVEIAKK